MVLVHDMKSAQFVENKLFDQAIMSYLHVIVTRFSFRFKADDPIDPLLSDERLDERIRLFKKYCYSSIINQTGKKFYWIIIIDPLLPEEYIDQLDDLIAEHKESENYSNCGPREIWLHKWDWEDTTGKKLGRIDWILKYFEELHNQQFTEEEDEEEEELITDQEYSQNIDIQISFDDPIIPEDKRWKPPKYLITTRLDDDDCLVSTFINLVNKQFRSAPVHGLRYLSFSVGYQHYVEQHNLRLYRLPMIALGLTLIAEISKYPICAYMGSHTKIPLYLKDPKRHDQMFALYKKNKELPSNLSVVRKQLKDRLWVIKTGGPVWVRNVHGYNLQKNIGKSTGRQQDNMKVKQVMQSRFNVTL